MRLLALLLLLAVLPTVELTEQAVHVVEHVLHADAPDHSAHHDESHSDEHGCTGLVHLCGHHAVARPSLGIAVMRIVEASASISIAAPPILADLTSLEPAHRPPIG